ncbi:MAG: methionyl-tRNA formyltransferase [Candidatus Aminicenantes bacterium]|nr:methionyl-tRNA formyltransferase [Candidatus Aminicenantes bacterium]
MRAIFFGSPEAALPSLAGLLGAGHTLELVVTQPDRPSGRGRKLTAAPVKRFALERSISVLQPERIRKDPAAFETIRDVRADIHVVVAYGQIIPASIIDLPRHHSINVHFSLLPKYRGACPVQWALLNGEERTGVTIFRLNEKMDEGEVLSTTETDIRAGENAGDLEDRLARLGADLLLDTLARIDTIVPVPQDHEKATLAPKIRKEDGIIDWTAEAVRIDRQVRALTPRPSAYVLFKERRLILLKGTVLAGPKNEGGPGEVVAIRREGIDVRCGDQALYRIQRLQPENRGPMDAFSFSLNGRIRPLDVLMGRTGGDHSSRR